MNEDICLLRYQFHPMDERFLQVDVAEMLQRARRRASLTQIELAKAAGTSQAAIARYETGAVLPELKTLTRLLDSCGFQLTLQLAVAPRARTGHETASVRPVVIPRDLDDPGIEKASGVIELPPWIRWSGAPRRYDLSKREERVRVYEQVLREGTADDIRRFIRVEHLEDVWDDLVLPTHLRSAWERWFEARRGRTGC